MGEGRISGKPPGRVSFDEGVVVMNGSVDGISHVAHGATDVGYVAGPIHRMHRDTYSDTMGR